MITFRCPTCRESLQTQDNSAGTKILCQKCGQKLMVPTPPVPIAVQPVPLKKTVLGELEETRPVSFPEANSALVPVSVVSATVPATKPRRIFGVNPWVFHAGVVTGAVGLFLAVIMVSFLLNQQGESIADNSKKQKDSSGNEGKAETTSDKKEDTKKPPSLIPPLPPIKVDPVLDALGSGDPEKQKAVLAKLVTDSTAGKKYLKDISHAIATAPLEIRQAGLEVLQKHHPELTGPVITILVDSNSDNRMQAADKLGSFGVQAKPILPILINHARKLRQKSIPGSGYIDPYEVRSVLEAICKIDMDDSDAVQAVLMFLEGDISNSENVSSAIQTSKLAGTMAKAGPKTRVKVVESLTEALKKFPFTTSNNLFGNSDYQQAIIPELIETLGNFGPEAKTAVPVIQPFRFHPNQHIRDTAEKAIARIAPG